MRVKDSVSTMRTLVQTFSNFIPKRLVQQLVETGEAMTLGGARREVTILFTDVVNFTGITENRDPAQVMHALLSAHHSDLVMG